MNEIWKDVVGYEGLYQVSNMGRVRSLDRIESVGSHTRPRKGRILRQSLATNGYLFVRLCKNNHYTNKRINRLVAETFIPNSDSTLVVDHIDGNKLNNRLDNLEWCTQSENSVRAFEMGLRKSQKGESHGRVKLSDEDVKYIRMSYIPYDKEFGCHGLAKKYNVSPGHICSIIKGVYWNE